MGRLCPLQMRIDRNVNSTRPGGGERQEAGGRPFRQPTRHPVTWRSPLGKPGCQAANLLVQGGERKFSFARSQRRTFSHTPLREMIERAWFRPAKTWQFHARAIMGRPLICKGRHASALALPTHRLPCKR